MAKNKTLELSIKIAGKMDKSLTAALTGTQNQISSFATNISKIGTAGLAAMGALATGAVKVMADCTTEAAKFENYMSDVVKYVDGLADATGKIDTKNYAAMSEAILDLSTQIPYTQEELSALAGAAGEAGKSMEQIFHIDSNGNVAGFLKNVAMAGTAMDVSADQAGAWAAKWETAFQVDHSGIMELFDQINYLAANGAASAADIAEVVNSSGALGGIAGMDPAAIAAMANAMLSMGSESSVAATSINRMLVNMNKGASATKAQKEAWESLGMTATGVAASMQEDATGTMIDVLEAIGRLDADKQAATLNTLFGQWAIKDAAKLAGNIEAYTKSLDMVNDPSLYTGSMEREFLIKATTPEALDTMLASSKTALQIEVGDAFLPAKKEFNLAMIDFLNDIRDNMPELTRLAETLGTLASKGISKLGDAMDWALPYIQKGLDYLVNNGDRVAGILVKVAAAFAAMKFAPAAEGLLSGAGSLLLGSSGGGGKNSGKFGGLFGGIKSLFQGGQNLAANAGDAFNVGMAAAASQRQSGDSFMQRLVTGVAGVFSGARNINSINSGRANTVANARNNVTAAASGARTWYANVASAGSGLLNTINGATVNAHANASLGKGNFVTNLLSNLFKPTGGQQSLGGGISNLLGSVFSPAKTALANTGAGRYVGGVASSAGNFSSNASSLLFTLLGKSNTAAPGASLAGNLAQGITGTLSSGAGLLSTMWGPITSGFGSLLSGALPIVGVISGIIAVVSILGDNLEGIRNIIGNIFGEQGVAVFDSFTGALGKVGEFFNGLFAEGGVASALAPLREGIANLFGPDAASAFDGVTTILQSVMGVIQQLVNFAVTTVKPIILDVFNFITQTVIPIILQTFSAAAPSIAGIISGIGSAVMTVAQIIGQAIQFVWPVIEAIGTALLNVGQVVIPAVLEYFSVFAAGLSSAIEGVKAIFEGVITFITGVFSGNWSQAWEGVKSIFTGIFDTLGALFKTPINAVISLINKAISGINGLGLTIPDWVPLIGGKSFSINIPQIPMLAKGGFTNGVSIAGEAGTEAVISFQRSVRRDNLKTWARAGELLGVKPVELKDPGDPPGNGGGQGSFTFAPNIVIQGNADRAVIEEALAEAKAQFETWYNQMQRRQARTAY